MSSKSFANILAAVNKMKESGGNKSDDSDLFWKCEQDKAGNGFAVIRFLPAKSDTDLPFVKMFDHGFQGPTGKWYIEKCPTTIDQPCPVCEANGPLWATGRESDKELVRKRKRRTSFIANILVVSDPKNPDNEGKVFLFKFGKKIFDKISEAMQPPEIEVESGEATPINPFDQMEGANFKLKIRKVEGYANYDKSEFDSPSEVKFNVEDLHDINQYIDPKSYKSYDDLKKRFLAATSGVQVHNSSNEKSTGVNEETAPWEDASDSNQIAEPKVKKQVTVNTSDDDDDMAFFKSLANDD